MSSPIESYALIGDTRTAALVGSNGSIDWLCLPRFDSGACFAALLGEQRHGEWSIAPLPGSVREVRRRYRGDSLVLETVLVTDVGTVRLVDFMPPAGPRSDVVGATPRVIRIVEGVTGAVPLKMKLVIRFDYGSVVPWVRRLDGRLHATAGPDGLVLDTPVATHGAHYTTVANFTVRPHDRVPFVLSWHPSEEPPPLPIDAFAAADRTQGWWRMWTSRCRYRGRFRDAVVRSLITLKALTYSPTGGIVAAATTSLPEMIGGVRNWDYRYTWLRDATFTLYALRASGCSEEAAAWRDWLLRAVAGDPAKLQIMYGVAGERRLPELTLDWLPGYAGSRPVRVGNAAVMQRQHDVYGEVMDALYHASRAGLPPDEYSWPVQRAMLDYLESGWREPDEGLWEMRGPQQHFTHSKVMSWVAFDRAVKSVELLGLHGNADRWRRLRDVIHDEVCARAFDPVRNSFTQAYGSRSVDAALLQIPLVGFLPPTDPRVIGTVAAIERDLMRDGLVQRYRTSETDDGLPGSEGTFLLCTFWLADTYVLLGRTAEAQAVFDRLLALRNDVGLLSEEYDPIARRMLGNFPQAFSHVGLINTALSLTPDQPDPAHERLTC